MGGLPNTVATRLHSPNSESQPQFQGPRHQPREGVLVQRETALQVHGRHDSRDGTITLGQISVAREIWFHIELGMAQHSVSHHRAVPRLICCDRTMAHSTKKTTGSFQSHPHIHKETHKNAHRCFGGIARYR